MVKERMVADLADYNGVPKKKKAAPKKKKAAPKKKKTAPKKKAATNKMPPTSGSSGRGAAMAPEQLTIFETWHYNSLGKKYFGELQMEYKDNDNSILTLITINGWHQSYSIQMQHHVRWADLIWELECHC